MTDRLGRLRPPAASAAAERNGGARGASAMTEPIVTSRGTTGAR